MTAATGPMTAMTDTTTAATDQLEATETTTAATVATMAMRLASMNGDERHAVSLVDGESRTTATTTEMNRWNDWPSESSVARTLGVGRLDGCHGGKTLKMNDVGHDGRTRSELEMKWLGYRPMAGRRSVS